MIPSALRLPLNFDATRLQADVAYVQSQHWQAHFNTRIYDGDWSGVPLRAAAGSAIPMYSDPRAESWEDTPLLQSCDYVREALAAFQCPLLAVRLLRLGAGSLIKEHRDPMLSPEHGEVRIHVVVATNPDVECSIDGVSHRWAAGECWYGNFTLPHSFANRGSTERMHIVLDCKVNDWLRGLLEGGLHDR